MTMSAAGDPFSILAKCCGLLDRTGVSPTGLAERYLYSTDMAYRYAFARWWGTPDLSRSVVWVLLNPATGDTDKKQRPTLDRCIARSRQLGADGIVIVNLFALRGTKPSVLRTAVDPVGPHNDECLRVLTATGLRTVAAWGGKGSLGKRSTTVRTYLRSALCLGTTAKREPRHPLYVNGDVSLVPLP